MIEPGRAKHQPGMLADKISGRPDLFVNLRGLRALGGEGLFPFPGPRAPGSTGGGAQAKAKRLG
jgi:hypothetical protein